MPNRLAAESSPYLRQHADNPVDWFPWGAEAFDEARARDVPVLLSIGYSACHWCHVMAHESFEDDATAALMNRVFVNVKVDREERPDVDAIYMEAVQALTGHGGWPMTVLLDHDQRPFWGGTYFPKVRRGGMPSFTEVCEAIDDLWRNRRDELHEQAGQLAEALRHSAAAQPGAALPDGGVLRAAAAQLVERTDPEHGGFGHAPKFPQPSSLEVLALVAHLDGDAASGAALRRTLDAMAAGGIYDHLGGGFARYSVDRGWLVPHFEKMLYDQALLVQTYLHAWQVTGAAAHRQVLDETITYVLRDLAQPGGGFAAAEDADSEGVEGKFYVWTPAQLREALGDDALVGAAASWWGVTEGGNFEGATILHRPLGATLERPAEIEEARRLLLAARSERVRPGLDDKVLAEWNGLFLAALAEAALVCGDETWTNAAVACGEFLLANLRAADGSWHRSWQADAGARHDAVAADLAALVDAFTRLAELTGAGRWVDEAEQVAGELLEQHWDDEHGGFFTTARRAPALVARAKDLLDNATPSANSAAAVALLRLGALTGETRWQDAAEATLRLQMGVAARHPTAVAHALAAVPLLDPGTVEIVLPGDVAELRAVVVEAWRPGAVLAWGTRPGSPLFEGRTEGSAYVCRGNVCGLPATDPESLRAQLTTT
jgi:uncharacterized protein YyaL (SSP411 family)